MSSSSDEGNVTLDEPYSQREEWKDVKPIEQDDGPYDIVRIAYTEVFKDVYGYLRAVLKTNEISERAFQLTKDAALLNPANYTVWYYRRLLIKALNKDLKEELNFITEVIQDNPKNYQVWQHRRCIVDFLKDPSDELAFTRSILRSDSKNYHAWQYRQYIVKNYDLWDNELSFVDDLINQDIRNNSAWNHRYFYINNTQDTSNLNVILGEIEHCKAKILKCVDNESVWNYMKAFIRNLPVNTSYSQELVDFCFKLFNESKDDERSPFLIAFLCDHYENEINKHLADTQSNDAKVKVNQYFKSANELLQQLATKYDMIREKYWFYVIKKWQQKYSKYLV